MLLQNTFQNTTSCFANIDTTQFSHSLSNDSNSTSEYQRWQRCNYANSPKSLTLSRNGLKSEDDLTIANKQMQQNYSLFWSYLNNTSWTGLGASCVSAWVLYRRCEWVTVCVLVCLSTWPSRNCHAVWGLTLTLVNDSYRQRRSTRGAGIEKMVFSCIILCIQYTDRKQYAA